MQITGGIYKSRKIKTSSSNSVRSTLSKTRESVFSMLFSLVDFEESSFLDVFSGSGIMSLEAVSRGFKEAVCIEKSPKAASIIKENYRSLNLEPKLYVGDCRKVIEKFGRTFNVIYLDPPFESDLYEKTISLIKTKGLLHKDGYIIIEAPTGKNLEFEGFRLIKEKTYGYIKVYLLSH